MIPADFIPYELTPEQVADGWRMGRMKSSISYLHHERYHDPAPGVPALRVWHDNGQEWTRLHHQQDLMEDPAPGTAAFRRCDEDGIPIRYEYYRRGVEVPADFHRWTIDNALSSDNIEARSVWFEINGWELIEDRLMLIDEQPDPANAGHTIRLYRLPNDLDPYNGRGQVLICNNASLDLDGSRRTYAIPAPVEWGDDALAVMAASYGLSHEEYEQVAVAK